MTTDAATAPPAPDDTVRERAKPVWRGEAMCAPLREGPLWERVLHYAAAALVVAAIGLYLVALLTSATLVDGGNAYGALLTDTARGEVVAIDDSRDDGYVLWRTRDGEVYAQEQWDHSIDLRASVAAQSYVQANPTAIRYERIGSRVFHRELWSDPAQVLAFFAVIALLGTGPEPRYATRFAWFWLMGTGVGLVAYLLFAGSRRRTVPVAARRLTGGRSFAALMVLNIALTLLPNPLEGVGERQGVYVPDSDAVRVVRRPA